MKNFLLSLAAILCFCCFNVVNAQDVNTCGTSYLCDGTADIGNASWGADCADGSDELLYYCCDAANGFSAYVIDALGVAACDAAGFGAPAPPACENTEVIYTPGSWSGENSFTITDCDGAVLAEMISGADGYTGCVELPENYSINLTDSYGDTWNGGTLTVGDVTYEMTLTGAAYSYPTESILVGSCGVAGCTDAAACNYNADATFDDGSCIALVEGYDCDGNYVCESGTAVTMGGGTYLSETSWSITACDGSVVASGAGSASEGCFDLPADYSVTMTDSYGDGWNGNILNIGGTEYTGPGAELGPGDSVVVAVGAECVVDVAGCMDDTACNYNMMATTDDGTCYNNDLGCGCDQPAAAEGFDCNGDQLDCSGESTALLTWVGDGYCDDGIYGQYLDCETFNFDNGDCGHCIDATALNYGTIADCVFEVLGCTDSSACNFSADANTDDASCEFTSCADCAGVPNGTSVADDCGVCDGDNSSCAGCDGVANSGLVLDNCGVCGGDNSTCIVVEECADTDGEATDSWGDNCASWYNDYPGDCGGSYDDDDFDSMAMCCACGGGETVTTLIFACEDDTACNYGDIAVCTYADAGYDCDGNSLCTGTDVVYTAGGYAYENSFTITACDGTVLAMMASGSDGFSECLDLPADYSINLVDSYGDSWNGGSLSVGGVSYTVDVDVNTIAIGTCPVYGCTDSAASNYNADATMDDDSCEYPVACDAGTMEAVLTMTDSYGDGWNGGSISVTVDGVLLVDAATVEVDANTVSACISEGVLAGLSCVEIAVDGGSYPGEMSWSITAMGGAVTLAAGDGDFGTQYLGCANAGCMDDTACNYDETATISTPETCTYPANEFTDCDGVFVCDGGIEFTLDMYDEYDDGWNGGTFAVRNWITDELVFGPVTLEDGGFGTTQACFPEDMAYGCYIIEVGGGSWDSEITWHLYGFEVFGAYVVDYSAGVSMEWDGNGNIVEGDSGGDCDDEDGFCEGGMDYPTGAGAYDIGYGCPCLDVNSPNYNPEQYDTADGLDPTDNTANPCDPAGCMDESALNYDPAAEVADDSCLYCAGDGTNDDATVAAIFGPSGVPISDCTALVGYVMGNYGMDLDATCAWDGTGSPFGSFGFTVGSICGCSCPAVTVLGCTDATACNYNADANIDDASCSYPAANADCDGCLDGFTENNGSCCLGSGSDDDATVAYLASTSALLAPLNLTGCTDAAATLGAYGLTCSSDFGALDPNLAGYSLDMLCGCACPDPVVPTCTDVTYIAGGYAYENSFTINDCDGVVLAEMTSGSDGFDQCLELPADYTINLVDSYGDSWNGGVLNIGGVDYTISDYTNSAQFLVGSCGVAGCTDDTACNFDAAAGATFDDGSCLYDLGCGCGEPAAAEGYDCDGNFVCESGTAVTMGGGTYLSETSWSITACDGSVVASGSGNVDGYNVAYSACYDLPVDYVVTMTDSYGDGWNGNVLNIGGTAYDGPSADLAGGESAVVQVGECTVDIPGCMDATACNYNMMATSDDGSCTFAADGFDCDGNELILDCVGADASNYVSWATDGYCDDGAWGIDFTCEEWNFDNGECGHCIDATASNYGEIAECEFAPVCTDIVYTAGSYAGENSFTITDCDGAILASMDAGVGAFEAACLVLPDNYVVNLVDSYGDGWNGGTLTIGVDVYDLPSDGWAVTPEGTSNSWTIGSCGVAGCTDATACNFDADAGATFDDGSCTYPVSADVDCDGACLNGGTFTTINVQEQSVSFGSQYTLVGYGGTWSLVGSDGTELATDGDDFAGCLADDCYSISGQSGSGSSYAFVYSLNGGDYVMPGAGGEVGSDVFTTGAGSCGVLGCMDDTACNYDAALGVTTDDGSCLYDLGCGCGEPAAVAGYDCDGNFVCDATEVTMGGGTYLSETSWSITDCDGNVLGSGSGNVNGYNVAYSVCVDLPEVYTVTMTDSYGDGWNGNILNIGGTEYTGPGAELGAGDSVVESVGVCCSPITVDGGSFQNEVDWAIYDCEGNVIIQSGWNFDEETGEWTEILGAPFSDCVVLPENYTIELSDSYGDGWNGNVMTIGSDEYTVSAGFGDSFVFGDCGVPGCMDDTACNYNADAEISDGSCFYPNACGDCSENNDLSCVGCMDDTACNYDADATVEGMCEYADSGYDCDGNLTCAFDFTTITYDPAGSWEYENSWTISDADGNIVGSGFGDSIGSSADYCMDPDACYTFTLNDSYGDGWNGNFLDAGVFGIFTVNGGSVSVASNCAAACEDEEVAAYWVDNTGMSGFSISSADGVAGDGGADFDDVVCIDYAACYTVDLVPSAGGSGSGVDDDGNEYAGTLMVGDQEFIYTEGSNAFYNSVFTYAIGSGCPVLGCMDETACNYNELAEEEDGSCAVEDCLGECGGTAVVDQCGECGGEDACVGCMDVLACNYSMDASIDDGSCEYLSCACPTGTLTVGGGSYLNEIEWSITACDGTVLYSGSGEEFSDCVDLPADYSVSMGDSWGDGWNGNTLVITNADGTVLSWDGPPSGCESVPEVTDANQVPCYEIAWVGSCGVLGCMDDTACNYNSEATVDDFTCTYPETGLDCEGNCLSGAPVAITVGGGTYDGEITWDIVGADGTAVAAGAAGDYTICIDLDNCYTINMNDSYGDGWNGGSMVIGEETFGLPAGSTGTASLGTCVFECTTDELVVTVTGTEEGSDFGFAITDFDGATVVMGGADFDGVGCFDLTNGCYTVSLSSSGGNGYDFSSETAMPGTLTVGDQTFDWGTSTSSWTSAYDNAFGSGCPVYGCTDPAACNYDEAANTDDGTCYTQDDCDADFCFTESFDVDGQFVSEIEGFQIWNDGADAYVSGGQLVISNANMDVATSLPVMTEGVFVVSFDMEVLEGSSAYFNFGNSGDIADWQWENQFTFNTDGSGSDDWGSTWTYTPGVPMNITTYIDLDNGDAVFAIDGEAVGQWGWTGDLGGVNWYGGSASTDLYAIDNFSMCVGEMPVTAVQGCIDDTACNYNAEANEDDGSCEYAVDGCSSCVEGVVIVSDTDGDGVADCDEVSGCQDMTACNYNPDATDADTCEYTDGVYDCDGQTCLADADGDGVCDQNEISGCTDANASNYSEVATDDDGTCIYPALGCTDAGAGNYDPNADTDDGSCDYGPWDVAATDCNMTVLLPQDLDITVEGEDLSGSIWIGVTDADGNVYGSSLYTAGEVNSIAVWGSNADDAGMDAGETLNWVVMSGDEMMNASVDYGFGAATYSCNGLSSLASLAASSVVTQAIDLNTGWNIWSTYVAPENPDMGAIFSNIVDDIVICKDEAGSVYWPAFGLNNINDITDAAGYQVKTSADVTLEVTGALLDPAMEFNIETGWGIIGYVKTDPSDAEAMMSPIVEDLVIMKDENGSVYWPAFGLNNIGNMMAGEGYQIKMDADAMFAYSSESGRLAYAEPIRTIHYNKAYNTGSNMTIGLPTTAWEVMPAIGDEIAAYDESGKLIGSTSFNGDNIALTVWGDDLTTDAKDGLATGEKVTFKLWNSDMNTESTLVVTKWDAGSNAYTIDGISIASNVILSGDTSADVHKLYQNVPNPFNGTTTIEFYVPENENVTLSVYNMLGEHVAEVTNDNFNAGKHSVEFDASNLGQGTYFVRMTTKGFTATKNMNIVK